MEGLVPEFLLIGGAGPVRGETYEEEDEQEEEVDRFGRLTPAEAIDQPCAHCKTPFRVTTPSKLYCSERCRYAAKKQRQGKRLGK